MMPLTATIGTWRARASSTEGRSGYGEDRVDRDQGLDGAITSTSACAIAAITSAVAVADSMPRNRTSRTVGSWWRCTKYSWNSSQPSSV